MWKDILKNNFFKINGKFNTKTIMDEYQLPTLYTGLQLQHLEIDTKQEKLLFMEQFTIDSKVVHTFTLQSLKFLLI